MPGTYILNQTNLEQVTNEAIVDFYQTLNCTSQDDCQPNSSLFVDTMRDSIAFDHSQCEASATSQQLAKLKESYQNNLKAEEKQFLSNDFDEFLKQKFGLKAQLVSKSFNQLIPGVIRSAASCSLQGQNLVVGCEVLSCFSTQEDEIYIDVETKALKVGAPFDESSHLCLPGSIKSIFKLTEKGFVLEQAVATNSILRDLCTGQDNVVITQDEVNFAKAEEQLLSAICDDSNVSQLRTAATAVLEHVIAAKKERQDEDDLTLLTAVLSQTTAVVKNPWNHEILAQYQQLTKQVNAQRSKKVISGSMLVLLGVALVVVSVLLFVPSLGITLTGVKTGANVVTKGSTIRKSNRQQIREFTGATSRLFSQAKGMEKDSQSKPESDKVMGHLLLKP